MKNMHYENNCEIPEELAEMAQTYLGKQKMNYYTLDTTKLTLLDDDTYVFAVLDDKYYFFDKHSRNNVKLINNSIYVPSVEVKREIGGSFIYDGTNIPKLFNSEELDIIKEGKLLHRARVCKLSEELIFWQILSEPMKFVIIKMNIDDNCLLKTMRRVNT